MESKSRQGLSKTLVAVIILVQPISAIGGNIDLQSCTVVAASPGNVIDGQNKVCGASNSNGFPWAAGGTVQCGTAKVPIPAGDKIVAIGRAVINQPEGIGMDFATWLDAINVVPSSGGYLISTQLKNWATFPRTVCLKVTVMTPLHPGA
jgi:hypothetical protein